MITKYTLTIDGIEHDLSENSVADSIKNWADIICAYKRNEYDGIVRSFSSKFDFVGDAYDMLLDLFMRDRYDAVAILSVYTINDDHTWMKRFECNLDFTTKEICNGVFSVGAVDNSLAAMIKANKGTKYEMLVGDDIKPDTTFHFDRIPMIENVTYCFSQGTSDTDSGALLVDYSPPADGSKTIFMGNVGDEISIGTTIFWKDDQENNADGFLIEAWKNAAVTVVSNIDIDRRWNNGVLMPVYIVHVDSNGVEKGRCLLAEVGGSANRPEVVGTFPTQNDLNTAYPITNYFDPEDDGRLFAIVGSTVYGLRKYTVFRLTYVGPLCAWIDQEQTPEEYFREHSEAHTVFDMLTGDKLRIIGGSAASTFMVQSSNINLRWMALGDPCDIPAFSPYTIANNLLSKITDNKLNIRINISDYDDRVGNTLILAAESIRGMEKERLYSTFGEFCDWMSTVFGYTYYLGDMQAPEIGDVEIKDAGYIEVDATAPILQRSYGGDAETSNIVFHVGSGAFVYSYNGEYYASFRGMAEYNTMTAPLHARNDVVFRIGGRYYNSDGGVLRSLEYQEVNFVHRSEIFSDTADVKYIESPKDVTNTTTSSQIFSSVEIGYDKKEYDKINGRDEWNFNSTYTTGCSISDKKLTLKSKYRCDCYGIEFAAQKRGKETSDTDSDNDVFFVYCTPASTYGYKPDRTTYPVTGALSDKVFNGAYSPVMCVLANMGYIGMQADSLDLKFASSNGNSDIVIDGAPMSTDITIDEPLMMSEMVEFTTDDDNLPDNINSLIEITDNGITYRGYINEVEMKFSRETAIKYQLLIKYMSI